MIKQTYVPVYLPDRTKIGTAHVDITNGTATIKIQSDSDLMELLGENLVGFSVMYLGAERLERKTEGEETDGST